jgi:hypothetical protein
MKLKRLDLRDQQMTVHAGTVLKVLGKSSLFILDILIRESVQNSLDAVSPKAKEHIRFDFDFIERETTDEIIDSIGFLEQSGGDSLFTRLKRRIKENDAVLLVLSDKGTTGLSGPIRRNDPEWKTFSGRKNFDNLVYQLGQNHGASGAGGSYGFGKSIYYHLSSAGLVMYYSRCNEGERLAFSMISANEKKASSSSTGISWWGDVYKHKGVEFASPIEDSQKIGNILERMGLTKKRFSRNETGTMICIVAPSLKHLLAAEDEFSSYSEALDMTTEVKIGKVSKMVHDSVIRWYWPRLTITEENRPGGKILPLKFYYGKKEILLPQKYKGLSELLKAAENSNNGIVHGDGSAIKTVQIRHNYGSAFLGTVAYQIIDMASTETHLNNIAMIRAPRMVVFEMPVQEKPDQSVAAVFLVNSGARVFASAQNEETQPLDDAFKDCESATHSEWNYHDFPPEKSWFKAYVKTVREKALKTINQVLNPVAALLTEKKFSDTAKTLGQILLAESSGGVQTFIPGGSGAGSGGGNISRNNPNVKILGTTFKENSSAEYSLEVNCQSHGIYELFVMAKGSKDLYDRASWLENLGNEFPFIIMDAASSLIGDFDIIEQSFLRFRISAEHNTTIAISLSIRFIKRDALITFIVKPAID